MSSEAEKKLLEKYLSRLPEKLSLIEGFINQNERQNLQSEVHKLAGSAGMYGFNSISGTAAEIEELIVANEPLESKKIQQLFNLLSNKVNDID